MRDLFESLISAFAFFFCLFCLLVSLVSVCFIAFGWIYCLLNPIGWIFYIINILVILPIAITFASKLF